MMTLRQMSAGPANVPTAVAWALADLGEARGKQELFTRQSPQRLKVLREHALIESAISSNRIEGVTVEQDRVRPVVMGQARLRDRDEEEVRGYRDALRLIHERHSKLPVSEKTIRELHLGYDVGRYISLERLVERAQGPLLRDAPVELQRVARGYPRSLALHQFFPVHSQGGL